MIDIIVEILIWIVLGLILGLFTNMVEYLIGQPYEDDMYTGRIFSFYGAFIRKRYFQLQDKIDMNNAPKNAHTKLNYWKALGMCPFCLNVHVIWVASLTIIVFSPLHWWGLLIALPFGHLSLGWIMSREWW